MELETEETGSRGQLGCSSIANRDGCVNRVGNTRVESKGRLEMHCTPGGLYHRLFCGGGEGLFTQA